MPSAKKFQESEFKALSREARFLEMLSRSKCECTAYIANIDVSAVMMDSRICWFVMEFIDGKDMDSKTRNQIGDTECIKVAQSDLAALTAIYLWPVPC